MKRTYSLYEAKAKLSEIIRGVRERGDVVTVSYHGEPVAEIRPIERDADATRRRISDLEAHGILLAPEEPGIAFPPAAARRRGALRRFLAERAE